MSNIVCDECKDLGTYKVYNAYDPNLEEEMACEYCKKNEEGEEYTKALWLN
jgi:hypothetical protein